MPCNIGIEFAFQGDECNEVGLVLYELSLQGNVCSGASWGFGGSGARGLGLAFRQGGLLMWAALGQAFCNRCDAHLR